MRKLSGDSVKKVTQMFVTAWDEANEWRSKWMDISQYLCPERGIFDSTPNKAYAVDHQKIIDSTGDDALRTMAAGFASGMSNPSMPWFKIFLADKELMEYKPVKLWLEDTTERMYSVLSRSNYYGSCVQVYKETGAFGTGAMYIEEDYETVIRCRTFTVGEYAIVLDSKNRLAGFATKRYMTASQLVEEYGKENVSPEVLRVYEDGREIYILVCNLIKKNDSRIPGFKDARNKSFISIHWEDGKLDQGELRVSGYDEFPTMCPRWETRNSSATYGIGPGWKALGDIKQLQKQHVQKLLAADKVNNPPTQRDANVDGESSFLPGGETFYSGTVPNGGVRAAYQINPDLNSMRLDIQETQGRIKNQFFYNLFLMFQGETGSATATEIMKKFQEKVQVLGPVYESFTDEFHDLALARVFAIMSRTGQIAEPPEELENKEFKFEYTSILAQALKMEGLTGVEQFSAFALDFIQAFPEAADVINADEVIKGHGEKIGLPVKMIRDENETMAIRQKRLQQQQYAQQQEQINQTIAGAKTMSETPMGNTTALDAVASGDMTISGIGGAQ
jgi:hypothetical protein